MEKDCNDDKGDNYYELLDEDAQKKDCETLINNDIESKPEKKSETDSNSDKKKRENSVKQILSHGTNSFSFPFNLLFMIPLIRVISKNNK